MKTILVVEDNQDVRENICEILELAGYDVDSTNNGADGVRRVMDVKPDLVLCDVMMPKLDGYAMLKMIRDNANTSNIPFIFLTAKTEQADFRKGMGLGADDYIMKPFDDTNLLESVASRLKRYDAKNSNYEQSQLTRIDQHAIDEWKESFFLAHEPLLLRKGEYLYSFERPTKNIFYVDEGLAIGESFVDARVFISQLFGPKDIIGLTTDSNHEYSVLNVKMLKDTKVYPIFKEDFYNETSVNRIASRCMYQNLLEAHQQLQRRSAHLAYSSVRKRVAESLIQFLDKDPETNCLALPREDLANYTGVAKETLIRTLSSFKSEGLIAIEGKAICVVKEAELRKLPQ